MLFYMQIGTTKTGATGERKTGKRKTGERKTGTRETRKRKTGERATGCVRSAVVPFFFLYTHVLGLLCCLIHFPSPSTVYYNFYI